jgi:hypothetical protein
MPRSGAILEATVSYYSNLAFASLKAMRETQEELRVGEFKTDTVLARGLSLWLDSIEGWWSALLVSASSPLPNVFLRLGKDSTTGSQEVRTSVPAEPQFTGLRPMGGGAPIDKQCVTVSRLSKGDGIEVRLKGMGGSKRPPAGLYFGLVHIADTPIATVMLLVEEPPAANQTSPPPVKV